MDPDQTAPTDQTAPKALNLLFSVGFNTFNRDLNRYKIVVLFFWR